MHGCVWRAGSAAIVFSLFTLPVSAVAADRWSQPTQAAPLAQMVQLAQNASDRVRATAAPSQPPAAAPANSPEQIKKAQIELRRLECLTGRIDGKLGDQTRQALKKFWASAKQEPAAEINITDELIAYLAERGDLFCRPVRRFFGFGGSGVNSARLPMFAPGGRPPVPIPAPPAPPPAPEP